MSQLMKCGHISQGFVILDNDRRIPGCVICECTEPAIDRPPLEGREAKCPYCAKTVSSSYNLAFFEHRPKSAYDKFYCGCRGWN